MALSNYSNTDLFSSLFDDFGLNPIIYGNLSNKNNSCKYKKNIIRCDVHENDNEFTILADLPGIKPEEISVEIDNGVLTIKGERVNEYNSNNDLSNKPVYKEYFYERHYGSFMRSFTLPENVNTEEIISKYNHGVLTISLPKTEQVKTKKIKINVE